ncbi:hypothetical protein [Phocaeicola faecicola]|jgi:hypothetical protein|uniref:hypothetical protein n=1 Tax=Phocaeicola faecicola TaxID=2739389 RepID=UPI0015E7DAE9|nr:hypothetical protein [Phocaeicola faecicola]MCI5742423.1 hypothetical protein [Bacteroides sp.]MDD6908967.1 hypothetical protein [Bacteroidaceae bacterium]MDY4871442.1 hypothetical protein [Phocaeicola faecicola]
MNLFKALSYKEWVKTRKFVFVVLLLLAAVTVYAYIDVTYSIRVNEAVNVWYGFIFQGMSVSGLMMYLMPLSGIAMAIVQFVPEMTNKRLKLTLHLPASETRLVSAMLLFGYGVLLVLYLASMGLLSLLVGRILPAEVICMMVSQLLPWAMAGLAGYGFTVWICVEPSWKQRLFNMLISLGLLAVFFVSLYPGTYSGFVWGMMLILISSFVFPFYSCVRFKQGIQ